MCLPRYVCGPDVEASFLAEVCVQPECGQNDFINIVVFDSYFLMYASFYLHYRQYTVYYGVFIFSEH